MEASNNSWVFGNAARILQSQYNLSRQSGSPSESTAQLAERYFLRAKAIDPNLDRGAIRPQLDLRAVAATWRDAARSWREFEKRAAKAVGGIQRLPVDAFPQLPAVIAGVLRTRNYSIPQAAAAGAAHNVVGGNFFASGQPGWAVLCSANNATSLLAFR